MPIEITEMIVRAKVDAHDESQQNNNQNTSNQSNDTQTEAIEKALAEVLEVLNRKKER